MGQARGDSPSQPQVQHDGQQEKPIADTHRAHHAKAVQPSWQGRKAQTHPQHGRPEEEVHLCHRTAEQRHQKMRT